VEIQGDMKMDKSKDVSPSEFCSTPIKEGIDAKKQRGWLLFVLSGIYFWCVTDDVLNGIFFFTGIKIINSQSAVVLIPSMLFAFCLTWFIDSRHKDKKKILYFVLTLFLIHLGLLFTIEYTIKFVSKSTYISIDIKTDITRLGEIICPLIAFGVAWLLFLRNRANISVIKESNHLWGFFLSRMFFWKPIEHTDDDNNLWCLLRAIEWSSFPLFIAQPVAPISFLFISWKYVVIGVVLANIAWRIIRNRYVNIYISDIAVLFVKIKWPISIITCLYSASQKEFVTASLCALWPIITLLLKITSMPSKLGDLQKLFMMKLGYITKGI
jgi:hypothetical protein